MRNPDQYIGQKHDLDVHLSMWSRYPFNDKLQINGSTFYDYENVNHVFSGHASQWHFGRPLEGDTARIVGVFTGYDYEFIGDFGIWSSELILFYHVCEMISLTPRE